MQWEFKETGIGGKWKERKEGREGGEKKTISIMGGLDQKDSRLSCS